MLRKETKNIQEKFASYCLNGELDLSLPVRQDRMHNYKRLIGNIVHDSLENAFPILLSIIEKKTWLKMVEIFITQHKCTHNQLFRMPEEFVQYAIKQQWSVQFKLPYLEDLLRFEWAEVSVHTAPDVEIATTIHKDLLHNQLIFNPYMELLKLQYPVYEIGTKEQIKGVYYCVVYRKKNDHVYYLSLDENSAALLIELQSGKTLQHIIELIKSNMDEKAVKLFEKSSLDFIQKLQSIEIILKNAC
jgi:hypothetical protein